MPLARVDDAYCDPHVCVQQLSTLDGPCGVATRRPRQRIVYLRGEEASGGRPLGQAGKEAIDAGHASVDLP